MNYLFCAQGWRNAENVQQEKKDEDTEAPNDETCSRLRSTNKEENIDLRAAVHSLTCVKNSISQLSDFTSVPGRKDAEPGFLEAAKCVLLKFFYWRRTYEHGSNFPSAESFTHAEPELMTTLWD